MPSRNRQRLARLVVGLTAALLVTALVACGDDDDGEGAGARNGKAGAAEKAFLTGMVHHHESAIEMAKIAKRRGEDAFVKRLADQIITAQEREIAEMEEIHERLFGGALVGNPSAHEGLGLTAEEAGMTHSPETNDMLRSAKPFDRAFVDEMVPHHEGALAMSEAVLRSAKDAELRRLAEGIVSAQEREISQMNDFRRRKFGAPVPAGAGHGMDSKGDMPAGKTEHEPEHSE